MEKVFFIDSKAAESAKQYVFAFENKLFSAGEVIVIAKFHLKSFLGNVLASKKFGFRLRFVFDVNESILGKQNGVVFYFFNSIENVKLIKNRRYKHVFFGHGESNKRASLHPLYRVYDYLLTAGPFAQRRWVKYGLLNQETVDDRVLDIGGAGVASLDYSELGMIGEVTNLSRASGLLYLPTWEGGLSEENYSVLDHQNYAEFLLNAVSKSKAAFLLVKPHPNIGSRDRTYKSYFRDLIDFLIDRKVQILISKSDLNFVSRKVRRKWRSSEMLTDRSSLIFRYAVVEVSAAESMAAKIGVKSVVLASKARDMYAPDKYSEGKGKSMIYLEDWSDISECIDHVHRVLDCDCQTNYIKCFEDDQNEKFKTAMRKILIRP